MIPGDSFKEATTSLRARLSITSNSLFGVKVGHLEAGAMGLVQVLRLLKRQPKS